jgi:DNA-binding transcriptional regulator YiaG
MNIPDDQVFAVLARRCVANGEFDALRQRLGFTLRQTAELLECDSAEVSRWCRGLNAPKQQAVPLGRLILGWMMMVDAGATEADLVPVGV